ncbi:MAG: hypothetical protein EHM93_20115, partial [Bacteroidales bacterium]
MKARFLFLLIIFSAFSLISKAQEIGFPVIRNYTPKEYNSTPQIPSLIQDNRGVMYFGLAGSIMEYDGISWRLFSSGKNGPIYDFVKDKNGTIYVAGLDEFGFLDIDHQGNTIYKTLTHLILDKSYNLGTVRTIRLTSKQVYFQTDDAILQYTVSPEELLIFKADTNGTFSEGFVFEDTFYTQLLKKGLVKIENNELKPAFQADFFKNKNAFNVGLPYNATTILISTRTEGLYLYKPNLDTLPQNFNVVSNDFFVDNGILKALAYQKEYFVLGSYKKGALLLDKQGFALQHYQENNLLQNSYVRNITTDTSQNIWLGLNNGISKIEHGQDLSYWDNNAGLKDNVESVVRYNSTIYIATHQKIYFIDKNNRIKDIQNIPVGMNWSLLETKSIKTLLAGTQTGIYEIIGDKAQIIARGSHAFELYQSIKNPYRVFSTYDDSFVSLKNENSKWFAEGKWEAIKDNIRGIIEDENGEIWLGTYRNGVIRITPNYENITKPKRVRYYKQDDGFESLKNILPFRFKNRIIWGSERGLYQYNSQLDRFVPFCELGEQFCNGSRDVFSLQERHDGKIWICSLENKNADIGYLQPNGKGGYDWVYTPFRRIPNMFLTACYIEPSGIAWIGGSEGVYRYDATKDTKNYAQQFNCLVRKVTIGRDSLLYGGNASATLAGLQTQLDYQFNSLRFEFAA